MNLQEYNEFISGLTHELRVELPGKIAHVRLAPEIRRNDISLGDFPDHALESAVLIIIYLKRNSLKTAVILRNEYDGAHSGQISLPGGKREPVDPDFEHTALRETHEEIGLESTQLQIIGKLSKFYVKPSNFIIYPFIAKALQHPVFKPDNVEVRKVIEIDLLKDLSYSKIVTKVLKFKNGIEIEAPGWMVGNQFMWGATAMIFGEFVSILERVVLPAK